MTPTDLRRLAGRMAFEPPWLGEQTAVVHALHAAAVLIESQAARIEAVLALHPDRGVRAIDKDHWCTTCDTTAPCPTRRALMQDTPQADKGGEP